jgi:hypothetical protein
MTSPYTVVRICQILFSKRCVDESVWDEVESENTSLEDKKRSLMGAIEKTVSNDHRKLHELATVLDQFKETKSVADSIMIDYNSIVKARKRAADEAVKRNIVDLKNAISPAFEDIVLACKQEKLIEQNYSSTNKAKRCSDFITHIRNLIDVQPAHLDTFLCILNGKDLHTSKVANSVAESCKNNGYNLPKYNERMICKDAEETEPDCKFHEINYMYDYICKVHSSIRKYKFIL